jgi:type IV pilus biogenesis protein CpaD/CtpE
MKNLRMKNNRMKSHGKIAYRLVLATLLAGTAISLASCAAIDPYERPGVWRPMGANDLNRELQVARPTDLVQGRGVTDSDGQAAAAAVDRVRADKVKALQDIDISGVGGGGGSGGSGGSGS